jgi:hypothetical protein
MTKKNSFHSKYFKVLANNTAAEANLAEQKMLFEEQTLSKEESFIYGARSPTVTKREGQNLEPR